MSLVEALTNSPHLFVRQKFEVAEFIGFETRNKYEIKDSDGRNVGYAAEQQKGFLNLLLRQFLGHWRTFDILIFDESRDLVFVARHPFRLLFQRIDLYSKGGELLGALQQRFSILNKRFDVQDARGNVLLEMRSPIWRIWTFFFYRADREVARVEKKWSGVFSEMLSDRDNFHVQFTPELKAGERPLVLAGALFIDLNYFEKKARS